MDDGEVGDREGGRRARRRQAQKGHQRSEDQKRPSVAKMRIAQRQLPTKPP